jgi:hypothetical protein
MQWDNDIATLALSDEEKDGLQAYRKYSASFTSARQKQFSDGVDYLQLDLTNLREVMSLITTEDIRLVPVIACAFADEDLKEMYRTFLPKDGPSGKSRLHDRFSPIGDLFSRIHFAYAFDMIHSDILKALDRLREHRNKVSHAWNPSEFADFFETPLPYMDEIEAAVIHRRRRYGDDAELSAEASLRVRTIWLLARLFYETRYYPLAKMAELRPFDALYGDRHPKVLNNISVAAQDFTQLVFDKS